MERSKFLTVGFRDMMHSLSVIGIFMLIEVAPSITPVLSTGVFPTTAQWISYGAFSLKAGIAYLIKSALTNKSGGFGPEK
ncbi:MAG TPA: hypothetical protein VJ327_10985 [Patescibacteria group bacterium]|nr:hypothetical protein [Patescibacteria group bacterium]